MHATFDGVHLDDRFVKVIRITREEVVIEGEFVSAEDAVNQMEIEYAKRVLSAHSAGDVVEFECEDAQGRELSGIATMLEVQLSPSGIDQVRFMIKMSPGIK